MTLATSISLKYQGIGGRSCSVRIVPHFGHSPSSPRSSSSTSASHSSHHAIRDCRRSLPAHPHAQFHRCGTEVELLPDPALYVADVRLGQPPVREEREGRWVGGALDDVADLRSGRGLTPLELLDGAVERSRRN